MTTKLKWVSLITLGCLLLSSLFLLKPFGVQNAAATSLAQYKGFLFPWTGVKSVSNGPTGHGYNAVDFVRTESDPEHFQILAPKDGVVVMMDDSSSYGGTCDGAVFAANYIVLGHGPYENGRYDHYSLYLHLQSDSIPSNLSVGSFVK